MSKIIDLVPVYNCVREHTYRLELLRAQTLDKFRFEVVVADKHNSEDVILWRRLYIIANYPIERTAALGKLP